MKRKFTILAILLLPLMVKAQDLHFSQFYSVPLYLNPALTGSGGCALRVGGDYHDQWKSIGKAFKTYTAWADGRLTPKKLRNDWLGLGLSFVGDKAGDGNLGTSDIGVSFSYNKSLAKNRKFYVSLGLAGNLVNKSLAAYKLTWESQWAGTSFDRDIASGESGIKGSKFYFDLNAGILATLNIGRYTSLHAGAAMSHLTNPNESLFGGSSRLKTKTVIHGGGNFVIGRKKKLMLQPKVYYSMMNGTTETVAGLNLVTRPGNSGVYVGMWYRFGRDLIPVFGYDLLGFVMMVSYDINVSKLTTASNLRGGLEISLVKSLLCNIKRNTSSNPKHSKSKFEHCPAF
ncbi:MAG: PorP/SprF family type IX secretion system membrane protein [Bacteroidota bacterium]